MIDDVTKGIEEYRLSEVGERLYGFVWDFFCDWYLELSKGEPNIPLMVVALRQILRLLHPYCPFVTEELWSAVSADRATMLIAEHWPEAMHPDASRKEAREGLQVVIDTITAIRKLRSDQAVEVKKEVDVTLVSRKFCNLLESQQAHIRRMGKVKSLTIKTDPDPSLTDVASVFLNDAEVHLSLTGLVDLEKERDNLTKEKAQLEKFLKGIQGKLDNEAFVKNAPAKVLEMEREKERNTAEKLRKIDERLNTLR